MRNAATDVLWRIEETKRLNYLFTTERIEDALEREKQVIVIYIIQAFILHYFRF